MKKALIALAVLVMAGASMAKIDVYDDFIKAGQTRVMSPATTDFYLLREPVYVEDGATLVIQPGTVIKALPSFGAQTMAALIVSQGGTIIADGTADSAIVMTSLSDNLDDPDDVGPGARGLWGGLVLCGYAPIDTDSVKYVEGLEISEKSAYGGDLPHDNSGVLRHVSIRHGGSATSTDKEVNGLTLCGVGDSTVVDYIEVLANDDDGIEFFGGTVDLKHAMVSFTVDDAFDFDCNWQGRGQFWCCLKTWVPDFFGTPDHAAEMDGSDSDNWDRFSNPTISNVTYVGAGMKESYFQSDSLLPSGKMDEAMLFRDNAAGKYYNSIITDFPKKAITISADHSNDPGKMSDSREQLAAQELVVSNCMFWNIGDANGVTGPSVWDSICSHSWGADSLANHNYYMDPQLRKTEATSYTQNYEWFDPRPAEGSPAMDLAYVEDVSAMDSWFDTPQFVGAFPSTGYKYDNGYWIDGWTGIAQEGVLSPVFTINPPSGTELGAKTHTELQFTVKITPWSNSYLGSALVLTDGVNDVTSAFSARHSKKALADGGMQYVIDNADLRADELGGVGTHTMEAYFVLVNGDTLYDKVEWNVLDNE